MSADSITYHRWIHAWAILTACAALPLIALGAEVTTKQVGLTDLQWPTVPWYLLINESMSRGIGFLIEHNHRLVAWIVGFSAIVLAASLWWFESRRWLRWLGLAAVLAVGLQGLLGGGRVVLHALFGPDLAMIHGIFGQLVFALLVSLAICTSRSWAEPVEETEASPSLRRGALLLLGLLLLQLVLGAVLRHQGSPLGQRGHLLMAFAVVAVAAWLIKQLHDSGDRRLWSVARLLGGLLVLQLALGVEAWLVKFTAAEPLPPGHWLWSRELARSGHVVVGALVLAAGAVLNLEVQRRAGWVFGRAPVRRVEEAA